MVQSTFQLKQHTRSDVLALMQDMTSESRKEPGCLSYEYFVGLNDNCQIVLVQEWESPETLQQHYQTAHMEKFVEKLGHYLDVPIVTRSYASHDENEVPLTVASVMADWSHETIH